MKKAMKKILSVILALIMIATTVPFVFAAERASGKLSSNSALTWSLDTDGTLTISGTGAMPNYGSAYDNPWTNQYRNYIKKVVVNEGVTNVGSNSLSYLHLLTSVSLPSTVTSIDSGAFACDTALTEITIPKNVTSVDKEAFYDCSALTQFKVDSANRYYKAVDGVLFSKDGKKLCLYPANKAGESYTVPAGTETVEQAAFYKNTALKTLVISEGVEGIKYMAFAEASVLTTVNFSSTVTTIDSFAFANCTNLTSVTFEEGLVDIYTGAFEGDTKLADVVLPSSVKVIAYYAFDGCPTVHYLGAESDLNNYNETGNQAIHFTVYTATVPSTCTQTGKTDGYFCEKCNKAISGFKTITIDKNAHNFDTTAKKVRPSYDENTKTWSDGYYEYTCAYGCGAINKVYADDVKRADYAEYDKSLADFEDFFASYDFTTSGKEAINKNLEGYLIDENLYVTEQSLVDDAAEDIAYRLEYYNYRLEDYIKTDFTEIDNLMNDFDELVEGYNLDESVANEIAGYKATLASLKADTDASAGDQKYELEALISKVEDLMQIFGNCADGKHIFYDYKSDNNVTCTEDGTETAYCSYRCGTTVQKIVTKLGHDYKYTMTRAATCEEPAAYTVVCSRCQDTMTNVLVGEAGGHKLSVFAYNGDATCTEDGTRTRTCIYCNEYKETETCVGTALGHAYTSEDISVYKERTCTDNEVLLYDCYRCDYTYTEEWENTKRPHEFTVDVGIYEEATCTTLEIHTYSCEYNCGATTTTSVAGTIKPHTGGTASCTHRPVCEVCTQEYDWYDFENHEGNVEITYYEPATCYTVSVTTSYCDACEKEFTEYGSVEEMNSIPCVASDNVFENDEEYHYYSCVTCRRPVESSATKHTFKYTYGDLGPDRSEPSRYVKIEECTGCSYNKYIYITADEYNEAMGETPSQPSDEIPPQSTDETPPQPTCDHMCHADGFKGFIWKIVKFFWKLFGMNPECECGAAHY